ncbi:hypothetical protein [Hominifimenecus sp. rT4P-3]|uniref:hypothetical protein n=1 Tax=Hominifimenecus sp. rT4P-3 TaxID=3242979 RepID=UPI003DA26766
MWRDLYKREIEHPGYTDEEFHQIREKTRKELREIMYRDYETDEEFFDAVLTYMKTHREGCNLLYARKKCI